MSTVTFRSTLDLMKATLTRAQSERPARSGWTTPDGADSDTYVPHAEPGWVAFERQVMRDAVNRVRAELGLPPVPLADIEQAESSAVGHSDYTSKLALYCTELALKEDWQ